jgi:hypothetical protein
MSPPQELKCASAYRVHVFPGKVVWTQFGRNHEEKSGISRSLRQHLLKLRSSSRWFEQAAQFGTDWAAGWRA